ncbi:hypothetical protein C8R42DRAFT_647095 [Lentinula raphanica]|nr:hypothetical protein C8R42DRAFT_647095 [Lentinula raphanica]
MYTVRDIPSGTAQLRDIPCKRDIPVEEHPIPVEEHLKWDSPCGTTQVGQPIYRGYPIWAIPDEGYPIEDIPIQKEHPIGTSQTGWGTRTGIGNIAEATAAMDKQNANANVNFVNGSGGNDNNNNNHNNGNANHNANNAHTRNNTSEALHSTLGTMNEKTLSSTFSSSPSIMKNEDSGLAHFHPRTRYPSLAGHGAGSLSRSGSGSGSGSGTAMGGGGGGGGSMVRQDLSGRSTSASSSSRMDVIEESYWMR